MLAAPTTIRNGVYELTVGAEGVEAIRHLAADEDTARPVTNGETPTAPRSPNEDPADSRLDGGIGRIKLEETSDIGSGEFTGKTELLILNLSSGKLIIVIEGGVVKELLIEDGLEEELEVAHETSVVTILVLGEDGQETVVLLFSDISGLSRGSEGEGRLDSSHEGKGPKGASNTHL